MQIYKNVIKCNEGEVILIKNKTDRFKLLNISDFSADAKIQTKSITTLGSQHPYEYPLYQTYSGSVRGYDSAGMWTSFIKDFDKTGIYPAIEIVVTQVRDTDKAKRIVRFGGVIFESVPVINISIDNPILEISTSFTATTVTFDSDFPYDEGSNAMNEI